jgi:hypothetical protein
VGTTGGRPLIALIWIGCVVQTPATTEPRLVPARARASTKTTRVNVARCPKAQSRMRHIAGASAIHSAEPVSTAGALVLVANDAPVDRFPNSRFTVLPRRLSRADTSSPGRMASGISTGGAGKSWYQAEYHGVPPAVQPANVPSCSSARYVRSAPPRPTQKAAELSGRLQTMRGWTQLPETAENARPPARTT